jgi:hypothetical protein
VPGGTDRIGIKKDGLPHISQEKGIWPAITSLETPFLQFNRGNLEGSREPEE